MTYRLRDDLYYCIANNQVALLDLPADRYFCLPSTAGADFRLLLEDKVSGKASAPSLAPLFSQGLIVEDNTGKGLPLRRETTCPASSLVDAVTDRFHWPEITAAIMGRLQATSELRRMPLSHVIRRIRLRKCAATASIKPADHPEVTKSKIFSFLNTGRFLSFRDQCLPSSVALIDFLASARCYPDLVIGVRLKPFSAHAWVQQGDIVLNDELDAVLPYTPILVI